ncbi:MAG: ribosome small subunit-dependent GTPase A [Woeseiaceae bacterium]|nr:ribosome small subunit-dependent GTPase A [Woeseiaceae bacterium]
MSTTDRHTAIVTAAYGRRMQLRLEDGTLVDARIKGRELQPVCGDVVTAHPLVNEPEWLVTRIGKRRNELTRPNLRGRTEILAANLDLLAAVCAPVPRPDWFIVDRYLCAAEQMGIDAIVVYNKADRGEPDAAHAAELDVYRSLDYPTLVCSAHSGLGLDSVRGELRNHTAIIAGQSGVGKSSLINVLTTSDQRTADVSGTRGEGRHTTVNTIMVPLPDGGWVVDSPGVRDYAPAIDDPADVETGFREIHRLGQDCRFANCRHRREPDCAVLAALDKHSISARRYESYKRMMIMTEQRERRRY